MKRIVKLTGMLLMLILACNFSLSAQRGLRDMRPGREFGSMERGVKFPDHSQIFGMRLGNGRYSFADSGQGIRGFERGVHGHGEYMPESIPNVTEKQKKDISDLKKKQQD
jgi:Spy/CpxP family protein refolding chaperone